MRSSIWAPLGLFCLLLFAGCGGGNGNSLVSTPTVGGQGRATLTIKWPAQTRLIPDASNSIGVAIKNGTIIVSQQVQARPTTGSTSTVTFSNLPAGNLSATASAFPSSDGTGTAQATATVPLVIVAGQNTAFSITMASTIDHLETATLSTAVGVGSTLQVTATAKDASGAAVLLSPGKLTWKSSATGVATVDATGLVTGLLIGTTDISVTDSESGKTAKTTVTVKTFGPIAFRAPVLYGVPTPNEIVTADFDSDGKVDLAVGTSTGLVILYGKGDGTFEAPVTVQTWTGGITPFSAADMNNDGKPDLVCVVSTQVLILHNLGGRTFASPIAIPCNSGLGPLVTADFNGDGKKDIAVIAYDHVGSTSTDIFIFSNQGGGVYTQGKTIGNIWIMMGLKTADLNGDGKADLIASIVTDEVGASGSSIYFGDGTGKFTGGGGTGTASFNVDQTAIGDFNGDGKLDYAIANDTDGGLSVILNKSNGTFGTPATYGGLAHPDHLAAVDIDGDGHPEIVVENRDATYFTVLRNQNALFPNQVQYPSGLPSGPLIVADVNGDGKPDVLISTSNGNNIAVILNNTP